MATYTLTTTAAQEAGLAAEAARSGRTPQQILEALLVPGLDDLARQHQGEGLLVARFRAAPPADRQRALELLQGGR